MTIVAGLLEVDALVRAQPWYSCGERSTQLLVVRVEQPGRGEVDAEAGRLRAGRVVVAEEGQVGDAAAQQRCRPPAGCGRPRPRAARCASVAERARSMQPVLEHQRRDDVGSAPRRAGRAAPRRRRAASNSASAVSILRGESCVEPAAGGVSARRGRVGAEVGRDDRQVDVEPVDQPGRPASGSSKPPLSTMPESGGKVCGRVRASARRARPRCGRPA